MQGPPPSRQSQMRIIYKLRQQDTQEYCVAERKLEGEKQSKLTV